MGSVSVTQAVAEEIRDAVLEVEGVAGLTSGRMGQAFLRVPGAMVEGIRLIDDTSADASGTHLAIYVVYELASRREIPQIVEDVQNAVVNLPAFADSDGGTRVDVVVADAA